MDFLPFPFAWLLAAGFLALLTFVLFLNVLGLPANWIILGLIALWNNLHPNTVTLGQTFWCIMIGLAVTGELLEWGLQAIKAKHHGASSSGAFVAMLGAFIGAILLAPLFWGLGALLGALVGAWLGCFCAEIFNGRDIGLAFRAAWGAMLGRFLGTICKCGVGGCMIALASKKILPRNFPDVSNPSLIGDQVNFLFFEIGIHVA